MDESLDLRTYWRILFRWWWVLVLGVALSGLGAWLVGKAMTPIYEASTKVMVRGGQSPVARSLSDVQAGNQLAENYTDLIKTRPILQSVIEELSLPYDLGVLSNMISVDSPRSLIEIKVSNPDPLRAASIANTIARTFIDDFLQQQLVQIARFQSSLRLLDISNDPSIVAAQASTFSTLRVVEEAEAPLSPSRPRTRMNVLLGATIGLIAAGGLVMLLDNLDRRVRSPEELKALTGMDSFGSIPQYKATDSVGPLMMFDGHAKSPLAESYRFVRTNLEFASHAIEGFSTLLVTSASPGEGKTTTAVNLGITMAEGGRSVILIDSDLRSPSAHRRLGIPGQKGLTNLLWGEASLEEVVSPTSIDGLKILPSGPRPPDPTLALRSSKFAEIVNHLKVSADLVILDSAPLLAVTDPMLIAPLVDCVILVVDAQRAARDAVAHGADMLQQARPRLAGTLINNAQQGAHYYYYTYDYPDEGEGSGNWRTKVATLIRTSRAKLPFNPDQAVE